MHFEPFESFISAENAIYTVSHINHRETFSAFTVEEKSYLNSPCVQCSILQASHFDPLCEDTLNQ